MKKTVSAKDFGKTITSEAWHTPIGLLERHHKPCDCSYCMENDFLKRRVGRVSPGLKAWNSWWYLYLRIGQSKWYLRYHSVFYRKPSEG